MTLFSDVTTVSSLLPTISRRLVKYRTLISNTIHRQTTMKCESLTLCYLRANNEWNKRQEKIEVEWNEIKSIQRHFQQTRYTRKL